MTGGPADDGRRSPAAEGAVVSGGARPRLHVLVGLIVNTRGELLVSRRRAGTHMAGYWEFPGGKAAPGEERRAALCRELAEELGIEVLDAAPFIELEHDYPDRRVTLDVWRVQRYAGEPRALEQQALRWAAAEELATIGLLPADAPIVDALLADALRSG